ncbi:hypothetical protein BIW11_09957 [Tropilaelaps mercedesae]|uniref:Uncharacterized protein n=1 Tax=Tropilaelaps mercedesae TaxID=418985 RepID=A0A1V9XHU6_9ACAR|nr:hypothetical protein BIW11_09957 [Tropilaelaps mercedesae]
MSDSTQSKTTGIEIPRSRDGYRELDQGASSGGLEPGGPSTPPNTPLSTSLNPSNSLLSKSWFAEKFHIQMMVHNTESGFSESIETVTPPLDSQQENSNGVPNGEGDHGSKS